MQYIIENIDRAVDFVGTMAYDEFCRDQKTVYAVVRALEIISEASRRIPNDVKENFPDIEWRLIAGAENVYRHDYDAVDEELVWRTLKTRLPAMREAIVRGMRTIAPEGMDGTS